jgi:putative hemolysin
MRKDAASLFVCILIFILGLPIVSLCAEAALPAKFSTVSENGMTWADAKAFCQQQGGDCRVLTTTIHGHGMSRMIIFP